MKKRQVRKGFTLIELMLSITFLVSLAVLIAVMVSHSAASYRQGVILKGINLMGTEIVEDLRSTINNDHAGNLLTACDDVYGEEELREQCKDDEGLSFVTISKYSPVTIKGSRNYAVGGEGGVPVYGAFCTGKYSYIWNSGYFFNEDVYFVGTNVDPQEPLTVVYNNIPNNTFKLLKVLDEKRAVCIESVKQYTIEEYGTETYESASSMKGMPGTITVTEQPVELITGESSEGLAIYDFEVMQPAKSGANQIVFYSGFFILGSVSGGVNIGSQGDYCKQYSDKGISDADYCAVNRFNFAVQSSAL